MSPKTMTAHQQQYSMPLRSPLAWLVSLGVGMLPGAPGTYGSALVAAAAGAWLLAGGAPLKGAWYLGVVVGVSTLAVAASQAALQRRLFGPGPDPGQITIDEAAGQLLALIGLAGPVWWHLVAAFGLFRLLDIVKPMGIRASQGLPGGWGVVIDDLLAGFYTALALRVVHLLLD
jgi:phosphatidylglycerophosphatase A